MSDDRLDAIKANAPGWPVSDDKEWLIAEIERLRVADTALTAILETYREFVAAHGSLLDFSSNAEMVDFNTTLAAAAALQEPQPE